MELKDEGQLKKPKPSIDSPDDSGFRDIEGNIVSYRDLGRVLQGEKLEKENQEPKSDVPLKKDKK